MWILFELSILISPAFNASRISKVDVSSFAFLTSVLHIVSPGGIFLSAPYAESPVAMLTFAAHLLQCHAVVMHSSHKWAKRDMALIMSGVTCGIATAYRSNGILNILVYCYLALSALAEASLLHNLRYLIVLGLSCLLNALGSLIPQALAWREYCYDTGASSIIDRPIWCEGLIPSIYTHVQAHYWGVGFLKYWTLSNLPLFLLAAPMLVLLAVSGYSVIRLSIRQLLENTLTTTESQPPKHIREYKSLLQERNFNAQVSSPPNAPPSQPSSDKSSASPASSIKCIPIQPKDATTLLCAFTLPQLFLTVLAFFVYHVQIITRISSAYPVLYWYLALLINDDTKIIIMRKAWWKPWKWAIRSSAASAAVAAAAGQRKGKKAQGETMDSKSVKNQNDDHGGDRGGGGGGKNDTEGQGQGISISKVIVRGWICYAMVQASLFGAFLPPA